MRCLTSAVLLGGCLSSSAVTPAQKRKAKYLAEREAFIELNSEVSGTYATLPLTPAEERVNSHLVSERDAFVIDNTEASTFPPQQFFYEWQHRDDVLNSSVWSLLESMPKGAALHLHTGSCGPTDWLISEGLSMDGAFVYWGEDQPDVCLSNLGGYPLACNSTSPNLTPLFKGTIMFYNESAAEGVAPSGFRSVRALRAAIPDFDAQLRALLVSDSTYEDMTSLQAWDNFMPIFSRVGGFHAYKPAFLAYMQESFRVLNDNHVQHAEIRATLGLNGFGALYDLDGATYEGTEVVEAYQAALDLFRASGDARAEDFSMRLIAATLRVLPAGAVEGDFEYAFQLKQAHPELVAGFDVVAEEDPNHATIDYLDVWMDIPKLEAKYGERMPLFFHDGESNDRNNTNLVDAVMLGCKRIGHGFNAYYYPLVREELKRQNIALEVNPISNQILRYVDNLQVHPASGYLAEGVPMVISSDDPGVFGYEALTYDFYAATTAWLLDLRALKTLAFNSLRYSALPEDAKQIAIDSWRAQWVEWVDAVDQLVPKA
mmetsp:Transcript_29171/g.67790  ORF Transcript_29171/g.67790 Transcript_29171/m.67790 type:complete len:544 (+) Transcript_29171:158-1789(+)